MEKQDLAARSDSGYERLQTALVEQRCVVLDGGIATELSPQHGQDYERLWGIEALASDLDAVRDVHRSYVDAGVDLLTTNTWALPTVIGAGGYIQPAGERPLHWMEVARRGVQVARETIDAAGRGDECAVAFSLNGDIDGPDGPETIALLERVLASQKPDLLLLETLSVVRSSLFAVVEALLATSIPVWLAFRRCPHGLCGVYGQHWGGPDNDAFGRAARRFEEMGVSALLVNCIPPDHVDGMVSHLRDFTDMPLGVYPNLGYHTSAGWRFESEIGGDEYAELALHWRAEGAQIIGGCCGTRPEHIAAARTALAATRPGRERRSQSTTSASERAAMSPRAAPAWSDRRGRSLFPPAFPKLARHPEVPVAAPGSYLLWRHLFEHGIGAHQRCLDIGSGVGLQTVQLALNGASHVHAIDRSDQAIANTLDNAFRNGVAERVTTEVADVYPWLPEERYELVVANLPQVPVDPLSQRVSHSPTDYWGRSLVDQVIKKLQLALAPEGSALLIVTSLLSRERTVELVSSAELVAEVIDWELQNLPREFEEQREHIEQIEQLTDAHTLSIGEQLVLVTYLLELRHSPRGGQQPGGQQPGGQQSGGQQPGGQQRGGRPGPGL